MNKAKLTSRRRLRALINNLGPLRGSGPGLKVVINDRRDKHLRGQTLNQAHVLRQSLRVENPVNPPISLIGKVNKDLREVKSPKAQAKDKIIIREIVLNKAAPDTGAPNNRDESPLPRRQFISREIAFYWPLAKASRESKKCALNLIL